MEEVVELYNRDGLSDLEVQGLIQRFEFTHELAWNILKNYFEYQGNTAITGSRDATREAFSNSLVDDGEGWMEMIKNPNQSSHTYNEEVAGEWQPETFIKVFTHVTQVTQNSLKTLKRQH